MLNCGDVEVVDSSPLGRNTGRWLNGNHGKALLDEGVDDEFVKRHHGLSRLGKTDPLPGRFIAFNNLVLPCDGVAEGASAMDEDHGIKLGFSYFLSQPVDGGKVRGERLIFYGDHAAPELHYCGLHSCIQQ